MDICLLFGKNVKEYRLRQGLSQEKLAELANLHRTYISAVERGVRSISLVNIQRLAEALEIKPYQLFIFCDTNETDTSHNEMIIQCIEYTLKNFKNKKD